mgnify:CR=1 FL=1
MTAGAREKNRTPGRPRPARWAGAVAGIAVALGVLAAAPAAADAQPRLPKVPMARDLAPSQRKNERRPDRNDDIPPSARPPAGMCRIWLDNVPAEKQPAPTDCASAVRNRPANARVIFGDDYARRPDGADLGPGAAGGSYALLSGGDRPHGPHPGDAAPLDAPGPDAPAPDDSTARRAAARPAPPPASRPLPRPAAMPATVDDWEAGYAAGYRDAMQGRRPRVRGVERMGAGAAARPLADDRDPGRDADGDDDAPVRPLVVPPGGDDPRYFNNGRFAPPGRANGVCLDRDADGWCDDPRYGAPVCRDLDGDGRCDDIPALASAPFPAELPSMRAGADVFRGRGSAVALRWLGTTEVIARVTDLRGTGSPSRVTWLDANTGALLQVWSDRDGDGTADRVEVYRNGRRVKLIGR